MRSFNTEPTMTRALLTITPTCQRLNSGTSCRTFSRKLSNLEIKNRLTTIARCHELMRERTHCARDMTEMKITIPSSAATHPLVSNDVPVGKRSGQCDDLYHTRLLTLLSTFTRWCSLITRPHMDTCTYLIERR